MFESQNYKLMLLKMLSGCGNVDNPIKFTDISLIDIHFVGNSKTVDLCLINHF